MEWHVLTTFLLIKYVKVAESAGVSIRNQVEAVKFSFPFVL